MSVAERTLRGRMGRVAEDTESILGGPDEPTINRIPWAAQWKTTRTPFERLRRTASRLWRTSRGVGGVAIGGLFFLPVDDQVLFVFDKRGRKLKPAHGLDQHE